MWGLILAEGIELGSFQIPSCETSMFWTEQLLGSIGNLSTWPTELMYIYHLIKTLKILEKNHKKSILSFRSQTSKFKKTGYMGFTASNGYCKFCTIFVLCMLWTLFKCPQPKRQKRSSMLSMDYIVCVAKYSMWGW